jgi:hypothetical protein
MKRWTFVIGLICLTGLIDVHGQTDKFKAIFIYNFTNYIEWPTANQGTFQIAVYGDSPIIEELNIIGTKKKIGSASIVVKRINSPAEIGEAKICYIPSTQKKSIQEITAALKGKNVLIITEDAANYFGINFTQVNNKQTFEVSKSNIEAHGLKVNSALIALGSAAN